jgi:Na+-transporting NADH:ubiquinone oxidoreductase subunit F
MMAIVLMTSVFLLLAALLLLAERFLVNYGSCHISLNDEAIAFDHPGGGNLLEALYAHEIFIPSGCGGKGTCGYCKVRVLEGAGDVLSTELPYLSRQERHGGIRLACQVKVRNNLRLSIPEDMLNARLYKARVSATAMLTHDIRELDLELMDPASIDHQSGQYVQVLVPGSGEPVYRAYSISSPAYVQNRIQLHVRHVPGGIASSYLHRVQVGDMIAFTGPYGDFRLSDDPDTEIICVGGGCGMAPMANIIETLYERWPERRCQLYFGCRTLDDVYYRDRWNALAAKHPGFKVVYALSEAPDNPADWDGDNGFIHLAVERHMKPGAKRQAFLCGPEPMVEAVRSVLLDRGLEPDRIYNDSF